ncbi:S-layer homology domain-containing protein [Anaerosphaera multitolerans]|uniref:S-layer homology domain-containing protein n=1 Tax=Anaerosphaera multitolerans TaxID=2487351 RepID=A0A437S6Y1_9FIRM|nr:S-layer homology domain-containing protein [Anaerosphaera multitolerans]RVU54800.1 S-layer homology domain-containing protein [Anaerosphaera multitolerans]
MKKFKKIMAVSLIGTVLTVNTVSAKTFSDVTSTGGYQWIYSSLDNLSNRGIFGGYPDGTFKPQRAVSFLEVMQVIKNVKNPSADEIENAKKTYGTIVSKYNVDSWATDALCYNLMNGTITEKTLKAASENGFLKEGNKLYPDRNSVSVYFGRALNLKSDGNVGLLKHNDLDSIPEMTKGYLASLIEAGIFSDTGSDGYFNGKKYISRAEVATIADKTLTYLENNPAAGESTQEEVVSEALSSNYIEEGVVEYIGESNSAGTLGLNSKNFAFDLEEIKILDEGRVYSGDLSSIKGMEVKATISEGEVVELQLLKKAETEVSDSVNLTGKVLSVKKDGAENTLTVQVLVSDNLKISVGSTVTIKVNGNYNEDDVLSISGNIENSGLVDVKVN